MIKLLLSALLAGTIAAGGARPCRPERRWAIPRPSRPMATSIPTCQQWSDACRACGRGSDGAPVCSNIGIACQPKPVQCTTRKEEPAK